MADNTLEITINARDQATSVFSKLGGLFLGGGVFGLGMKAANAAIDLVIGSIGDWVGGALEAQGVQAQLNSVLKATGGVAGVTAEMANNLASSLMGVTRFEDETILSGENMLLTFKNIGSDVFPAATEAMLDMSQAMGQDIKSSAIQLGKALNDPLQGMSALTRVGVTFNDEQKKMIERMMKAGDVAGAQKVILDELSSEFGGAAKAAGETFAGQMDILKNSLGDVAEGIVGSLLPAGQQILSDFILPILPKVVELGERFGSFVAGVLGGLAKAMGVFSQTGSFADFFGMIGVQIYDLSPVLGQFFIDLGRWIQEVAVPAFQQLGDWLMNVGIPAFMSFISVVWSQLGPGLAQLGTWIQQIAAVVLPLLGQAFQFVIDHINIFGPILAAIGVVILALTSPISLVIAAVVLLATAWANNWGGIQEKVNAVIGFLRPFIENFISGILQFWAEHGDAILAKGKEIWDGVVKVFEWFKGQWSKLFDAWSLAFKGDWHGFGQKIREGWDEAWKQITEIFNRAVDAIKKTDWGQVGKNIVQGIAHGITAATDWAIKAIQGLASSVIAAIKGFLGIASPSKIFEQLGLQAGVGFQLGLLGAAPGAASAGAQMAGAAVSGSASYTFNQTVYTNSPAEPILSDFASMQSWWRG